MQHTGSGTAIELPLATVTSSEVKKTSGLTSAQHAAVILQHLDALVQKELEGVQIAAGKMDGKEAGKFLTKHAAQISHTVDRDQEAAYQMATAQIHKGQTILKTYLNNTPLVENLSPEQINHLVVRALNEPQKVPALEHNGDYQAELIRYLNYSVPASMLRPLTELFGNKTQTSPCPPTQGYTR